MRYFLLVFDPAPGDLIAQVEFPDAASARKARVRVERERAWDGRSLGNEVEVVVRWAESAEALRRTHGRYFMTAAEMAREAALTVKRLIRSW
ncbi:hypothetical protein [Actinoplanes subtropicus]|uniref:hypothetical protein n=1 Tax=Actinoplanes subtropicus TaxID=543632 RepID=UPI0004C41AF1|nr:hypothetical protein [Actinoplanes subtropicus]